MIDRHRTYFDVIFIIEVKQTLFYRALDLFAPDKWCVLGWNPTTGLRANGSILKTAIHWDDASRSYNVEQKGP